MVLDESLCGREAGDERRLRAENTLVHWSGYGGIYWFDWMLSSKETPIHVVLEQLGVRQYRDGSLRSR